MSKAQWCVVLIGMVVIVALPFAGRWARRQPEGRCAFDGGKIEPRFRVGIVDAGGLSHDFCCIHCAERWLDKQALKPQAITVTDEISGLEIDPGEAIFVRSSVITTATTRNRIHVFRYPEDARRHAEQSRGSVLSGAEKPLQGPRQTHES
jgi:hypothetical protein